MSKPHNRWCPEEFCSSYTPPEKMCEACKAVYDEVRELRDKNEELENALSALFQAVADVKEQSENGWKFPKPLQAAMNAAAELT